MSSKWENKTVKYCHYEEDLMKRNKISRSVSQVVMPIMVDKMKGEGVNKKKIGKTPWAPYIRS